VAESQAKDGRSGAGGPMAIKLRRHRNEAAIMDDRKNGGVGL
jgi:hypothetical protein